MANNQYNFLDYAGLSLFWNNVKNIIEENELTTATALTNLDTRVDNLEASKSDKGHTHNFGEIAPGVATIGDGVNRLMFRTNSHWLNGMYYSIPGNEALVFGTINPVTSWIFATVDPTLNTAWTSLTPSLQIKNGRVTINKLIPNNTDASYNLDVNGSANATTLYENGTRVSVSGHTHIKSQITDFPSSLPASDVYSWAKASSKPSYTYSEVGAAAASHNHDDRYYTESEINTKLSGKSDTGHTHTKSQITDFPSSLPASDVYSWAKASSKPSYTYSEVGAAAASHTHDDRYYTESEINTKLSGKSNTDHTHDDRYYTESEINTKLAQKQDIISDIDTIRNNAANYKGTVTSVKVDNVSKAPYSGVVNLGYINKQLITSTAESMTLYPNIYYRNTNTSPHIIAIGLADVSNNNIINEYFVEFTTSSSGTTIALPSTIKWANGEPPTFEASTTYQISIVNNLGVVIKFK